MRPAEKRSADAIAPRLTRATGPIQPRFTASTKKKTTPRSVTMPPAQASTCAEKRSAKVSPLHQGGSFGGGGGAGGNWRSGRALGADPTGGVGAVAGVGSRTTGGGTTGVGGTVGGGKKDGGGGVAVAASSGLVETARRRSASSLSREPRRRAKSSTFFRRSSVGPCSELGGCGFQSGTGIGLLSVAGAGPGREITSITRKSGATKVFNHQRKVCFQTAPKSSLARTIRTESAIQSGAEHRAQMTPATVLPTSAKISA